MASLVAINYPDTLYTLPFPWTESRVSFGSPYPEDNRSDFYQGGNATVFVTSDKSGYRVIGFKQAIRVGAQAGSPYSIKASRLVSSESGEVTFTKKWGGSSFRSGTQVSVIKGFLYAPFVPGFHVLDDSTKTTADNHALVRFYSALRAEMEHWNSLVFLGELREIVAQVRRPYAELQGQIEQHLDRYKRAALRKKFPKAMRKAEKIRRLSRLASSMWLETAFATLPTLSDVKIAAETLARFSDERRRSRVKGFAERSSKAPVVLIPQLHPCGMGYTVSISHTGNYKVSYVAGLNVNVQGESGSMKRLAELAGLDPRNLPVTLYELVPYSWLADYITTAGACLSSHMVATTGVNWAISSKTERTTTITLCTADQTSGSDQVVSGTHCGKGVTQKTTFSRAILNTANLPRPMVQVRPLSDVLPSQAANVLALLVNRANAVSRDVRRVHRI